MIYKKYREIDGVIWNELFTSLRSPILEPQLLAIMKQVGGFKIGPEQVIIGNLIFFARNFLTRFIVKKTNP